jgi:hypothetical protein
MTTGDDRRVTAHHEAAHTVVSYRLIGVADDQVSIVPMEGTVGTSNNQTSDSLNPVHMEARVLSLYAGGHAQRVLDPDRDDEGCQTDEELAADELRRWGWQHREQELRDRSAELVRRHWVEITAVAEELLRCDVLDATEVEILADGAAGDPEYDDLALAKYRAIRAKVGVQ